MTTSNFDTWLTSQFENGLVDIKFAVFKGKGVSAEAVKAEIVRTEARASNALGLSSPPKAMSSVPENIMAMFA